MTITMTGLTMAVFTLMCLNGVFHGSVAALRVSGAPGQALSCPGAHRLGYVCKGLSLTCRAVDIAVRRSTYLCDGLSRGD